MTQAKQDTETSAQYVDQAIQLHRVLTDILKSKIGMHDQFASAFAAEICDGLLSEYGGSERYWPRFSKSVRNAAIRAEFNGTNAVAICRTYGISRPRLYQIVREGSKQS